ncbi:MAG: hypothetical protein DME22_08200 [Verrucomicrobia bacterium]|nr:MAG: hypothetical protein DME22_08200 [Verrucomicrobiota bacterium]PYJ99038.1 MAG: hypothetical protein DME23_10595 [Verrucomicrobiota bacterium]
MPQDRFTWNIKTLVESYEKAGHANRAWDEPAKRALTEFARARSRVTETNEPWGQIIATNCDLAVEAGCNDPMIAYLHTRFSLDQTNSSKVFADAFCKAAQEMQQSSYPSIRKFYATLRAAEQLKFVAGTNTPTEVHHFRHLAATQLAVFIADRSTPVGEVDDACQDMFKLVERNNRQFEEFYRSIEKPLFQNWPKESVSWLLKGQFYIKYAWAARGGGYANTVSQEGWRLFSERLAAAETALAQAWELNPKDPRTAVKMMWVELGQGRGRSRMELWFRRAMELDPNSYDACNTKLLYLEPKWHGSIEEMLKFGRECVESKEWSGHVPLVLADAHDEVPLYYLEKSDQATYWKRPEVWLDIKAAFEKFFWLNPNKPGWHHNYARYAYWCEQWDELNQQLLQLGPVNYDYFGGKEEFDKMVLLAKQHAAPDAIGDNK